MRYLRYLVERFASVGVSTKNIVGTLIFWTVHVGVLRMPRKHSPLQQEGSHFLNTVKELYLLISTLFPLPVSLHVQ